MNEYISSLDRQNQIARLLSQRTRLSVSEICIRFSVSAATARRDLETLAGKGRLQRVRGGAITYNTAPPEQPILERAAEETDPKHRIGVLAAGLVGDGETVFLGSGTTVLEVARGLAARSGLTILTNSLPVVNLFAGSSGINLICLGGELRTSELSFIGHLTEQSLAEVHADRVFTGTRAISLEMGLTNDYLPETMTDRAILRCGREVVVVADHTKLGRTAYSLLASMDRIHTLVTDSAAPADFLAALRERGIRVFTA